MRKEGNLTQAELGTILGGKSRSYISRIENAKAWPSAHALIASTIFFGRSIEYLFKSLYDAVEEQVIREAYLLYNQLTGSDQAEPEGKGERLGAAIQAIIDRHKQK